MKSEFKTLLINVKDGSEKFDTFKIGDFFGPIDLGLHLSKKYNSLNIGTGLFAGSVLSGSNRLVFTGNVPAWDGFYISTMGSAALVFQNLGLSMLSIMGKATNPSVLYINRKENGEIETELKEIDIQKIWGQGRTGIYSLMDYTYELFGSRFDGDPRILATGQSALSTDFGAVGSVPIKKGVLSYVDTWAGRGGFGSQLLQEHGIAAIIYGGAYADEGFRDRKSVDQWFMDKYSMKFAKKDKAVTVKYNYDPKLQTGGTLGANYSTIGGAMFSSNYKSIYMNEDQRVDLHKKLVYDHYLVQFKEETKDKKSHKNCGEPCAVLCKKMNGKYKKDYEPYQAMGPLCGIYDQRAAEKVNHHADSLGFDAISIGGVLSWLMECLIEGLLTPEELGVKDIPKFDLDNFDVVTTSMYNANIAVDLLDSIIQKKALLNLEKGTRVLAKKLAKEKNKRIIDLFIYNAHGEKGWMVPNQYWTPGAFSPMAIMGKYYMYYGSDFMAPRELGKLCAQRFKVELIMDNIAICRFHRGWAEDITPELVGHVYGLKDEFLASIESIAKDINSNNKGVFWESKRNTDIIYSFLKRKYTVDKCEDKELIKWLDLFNQDKEKAGLHFWTEMREGIEESL